MTAKNYRVNTKTVKLEYITSKPLLERKAKNGNLISPRESWQRD